VVVEHFYVLKAKPESVFVDLMKLELDNLFFGGKLEKRRVVEENSLLPVKLAGQHI